MFEEPLYGLVVGAVLGLVLGIIYKRQILKHLEKQSGTPFLEHYMANKARGNQFKWIVLRDFVIILLLLTVAVVGLYIIFYWGAKFV